MLVLTRKLGEGIAIGEDIKIVVMQIKGKQVRLGIKAKPTTTVHREEVYQKILDENLLASGAQADELSVAQSVVGVSNRNEAGPQFLFRKKSGTSKPNAR